MCGALGRRARRFGPAYVGAGAGRLFFHEIFEEIADELGPALVEVVRLETRMFVAFECFEADVGELDPRAIAFGCQLKGDEGVTGISFESPFIADPLVGHDFGDLPEMRPLLVLVLDGELRFESDLWLEVGQGRHVPLFHLVDVGDGAPYFFGWSVVNPLYDDLCFFHE